MLITVTDDTFDELVLRSPKPIVVDFWAEWCPPCRPMARILDELALTSNGSPLFAKINSDENPAATRTYRVLSMPTLLLFEEGQVVKTIIGLRPKSYLRQAFLAEPYVNQG